MILMAVCWAEPRFGQAALRFPRSAATFVDNSPLLHNEAQR
jgi:hypothetical protein